MTICSMGDYAHADFLFEITNLCVMHTRNILLNYPHEATSLSGGEKLM